MSDLNRYEEQHDLERSDDQWDDDHAEDRHEHDDHDEQHDHESGHQDGEIHDDSSHEQNSELNDVADDDSLIEQFERADVFGNDGADDFMFSLGSDIRVLNFDADEGDTVVFDTGANLTNAEELAQYVTKLEYDGNKLSVDFGDYGSLELVGIRADQISWDLIEVN